MTKACIPLSSQSTHGNYDRQLASNQNVPGWSGFHVFISSASWYVFESNHQQHTYIMFIKVDQVNSEKGVYVLYIKLN